MSWRTRLTRSCRSFLEQDAHRNFLQNRVKTRPPAPTCPPTPPYRRSVLSSAFAAACAVNAAPSPAHPRVRALPIRHCLNPRSQAEAERGLRHRLLAARRRPGDVPQVQLVGLHRRARGPLAVDGQEVAQDVHLGPVLRRSPRAPRAARAGRPAARPGSPAPPRPGCPRSSPRSFSAATDPAPRVGMRDVERDQADAAPDPIVLSPNPRPVVGGEEELEGGVNSKHSPYMNRAVMRSPPVSCFSTTSDRRRPASASDGRHEARPAQPRQVVASDLVFRPSASRSRPAGRCRPAAPGARRGTSTSRSRPCRASGTVPARACRPSGRSPTARWRKSIRACFAPMMSVEERQPSRAGGVGIVRPRARAW